MPTRLLAAGGGRRSAAPRINLFTPTAMAALNAPAQSAAVNTPATSDEVIRNIVSSMQSYNSPDTTSASGSATTARQAAGDLASIASIVGNLGNMTQSRDLAGAGTGLSQLASVTKLASDLGSAKSAGDVGTSLASNPLVLSLLGIAGPAAGAIAGGAKDGLSGALSGAGTAALYAALPPLALVDAIGSLAGAGRPVGGTVRDIVNSLTGSASSIKPAEVTIGDAMRTGDITGTDLGTLSPADSTESSYNYSDYSSESGSDSSSSY